MADAHHLRSIGDMAAAALKNGDDYTVPLCRNHHHELHHFGSEELFFALHGIDAMLVLRHINGGQDEVQENIEDEAW